MNKQTWKVLKVLEIETDQKLVQKTHEISFREEAKRKVSIRDP